MVLILPLLFTSILTACFKRSINPKSKLFIQDGDPSQNSKAARVKLEACGAKLIKIPPCSPDINPIENFFNLVEMKLDDDTEKQNITKESFEEFSARVKRTMLSFPADVINKTIGSSHKRMKDIITAKMSQIEVLIPVSGILTNPTSEITI